MTALPQPHDSMHGDLPTVADAVGMHTWHWEIGAANIEWSSGVERALGMDPGSFDGRFASFMAVIHPDDRAAVQTAIERALSGEAPIYRVEHRVVTPSGQLLWLECRGHVFRDPQGKPLRVGGIVLDITARKEAEARAERVSRLAELVRAINKRILHVTQEHEIYTSACNIAVELGLFRFAWIGLLSADGQRVEPVARCGHDEGYLDNIRIDVADTVFGRGPIGVAVREKRVWVAADIATDPIFAPWREAALSRGYRSCGAFPLRRAGVVVGALAVYSDARHQFDDEQIALLAGLADDIGYALDLLDTEQHRREAENALRASEERYRTLFENAFEGIVLVDAAHRIVDANESASRMFGYRREELLTLRAEDVVHPDDTAPTALRFETIRAGGVILSERRFVRKDRSVFEGEVSTKALVDGRYQVVFRDVTERKSVQAQLLLADRMTSLGRLASGVAHEVNNPLAYVMLNLELLAKRLGEEHPCESSEVLETMRRSVADARDGAERMRRVVRMLTTFGRGDEEKVGPVDVNAVLDSAAEIAAMQLRHRARVVKQYDATSPASANDFRLGQVFVNLLVNAADALGDDDKDNEIRLRSYLRDDAVVVEVSDNGVGIPRAMQTKIFDPFFTTKPIGKGTGLGLSVCHAIVTSFGGAINVESEPGKGTTFRVSLPIAKPGSREAARSSPRGAREARGRVLVVDDDEKVASAVAIALAGNEVVVVSSGKEAIERCRADRFDCVLCDLMMPETTGVDVYEALRKDERGMEKRIVFMTGGAATPASRELLARVKNPVLEKPIDIRALRGAVSRMMEAK